MRHFTITLDAGESSYMAHVEPIEDPGIIRYDVSVLDTGTGTFNQAWHGIIEHDADGWKQTRASVEKGPILSCFLVEEIGEQIENHFK